ncbi:MAG TPA: CHC2 zinc finger domain-containing protein, partial [Candidatus Avimonas sp.]|nr:CHC2 zinc finger domain-containing protein [Candidatus Avimonas sp.]
MALPDMFLQELISRNPITDVVSSYVRLRQRGRTAVGLCPFHGEKSPSFSVSPTKQ